jgi:trypsin
MTRTLLILSIIPSVALAHKRIIGGSEVAIEDLPYQVNILVYGTFAGGGSIVDETHILTAAHCVSGSPTDAYTVHAGSALWASGGMKVNVSSITKHPEYGKPIALENDIAIVTLAESLTFGPYMQPISLPRLHASDSDSSSALVAGQELVVSGWGDTGEGRGMSSTLHAVTEEIIERGKLQRRTGEIIFALRMGCSVLVRPAMARVRVRVIVVVLPWLMGFSLELSRGGTGAVGRAIQVCFRGLLIIGIGSRRLLGSETGFRRDFWPALSGGVGRGILEQYSSCLRIAWI